MAAAQNDAPNVRAQHLVGHGLKQHVAGEVQPEAGSDGLERQGDAPQGFEACAFQFALFCDPFIQRDRQVIRQQRHGHQMGDLEMLGRFLDALGAAVVKIDRFVPQKMNPLQADHEPENVVVGQERRP